MATCRDPEGWHIVSRLRVFDATLCFEEGVVLSSLLGALLFLATYRSLALSSDRFLQGSSHTGKSLSLLWTKLVLLGASIIASISNITYILMIRATVPGVFYSYIVEPLALGSAITLTYLNHTQTRTSSSVLLVFWPLYLVGLAVWVRTTLTMGLDTGVVLALKSVVGGLGFLSFALECLGPEYGAEFANKLHTKNPLDTANIFTVWTSGWITPLMKKGASQLITESDIPPLRAHDESEHLGKNLQDVLTKHTLWKALFVSYGKPYAVAAVLKVLHDCLALLQPQLLRWLLSFMSRYQTGHYKDSPDGSEGLQGFVISVLMFAVSIAQTVALNQYFQRTLETGMRVRAGLVTAIYAKALVLSNDERTRASGDIVNLMSVDATRLQDLCTHGLLVISGPVQITLAFASLYNLLGWAALPIVVIMIISIPLNTFMMQVIQRSQAKLMKIRDKRARLMSELLANIKSIKLYAWEYSFTKKLLEVRDNQELKTLKQHAFAWQYNLFIWRCIPTLAALASFAVAAAVSSKPLTPDIIFPAMTLFLLLQSPFIMIGQVTSSIIEGIVSVKRVSEFLNAGELQHDMRRLVTAPTPLKRGDEVLFIKDADFAWEKNAVVPTLEKIDLLVKKGDLFGVLGSVGAGKTSLLSAIIGQMTRKEGQVVLPGSIAYAPQNPWILSATIRENILFSHEYDDMFYNLVIDACALREDLALLPQGDHTEVGEKGITLSGGQQARISLARAVYARADLVLLDDCLAALDSHVARHVFDNVIGPHGLLATKARILVTNSIAFLKQFDQLVYIRRGIILQNGSYDDIVSNTNGALSRLIIDYGSSSSGVLTPSASGSAILGEAELVDKVESSEGAGSTHKKLRHRTSFATARIDRLPPMCVTESTGLSKEHQEHGHVKLHVYKRYIGASSIVGLLCFFLATSLQQAVSIFASLALRDLGEHNREAGSNQSMMQDLVVYGVLSMSSIIISVIAGLTLRVCTARCSRYFHNGMLDSLMRAPLSFFELTPTGRILNLFSRDTYIVDQMFGALITITSRALVECVAILVIICVNFPPFVIALAPFIFFYSYVMRFYLATIRDLKRLDAVSRTPIFAWFSESLAGLSTIRAFNQQPLFISANGRRIDRNHRCYVAAIYVNRWLAVRLELVGAVITLVVAVLAVRALVTAGVDAGLVGLVLSYTLNMTSSLSDAIRTTGEFEQNIVSVERILHQTEVQSEAPLEIPETKPSGVWPSHGQVEFRQYSTRYRAELELVLKDISFVIIPKEKIGVCGRTGAGKSSLLLALFRIIEPVEGTIFIDSVDITKVGLHDLRSNISIVPQSPDLFGGTLRENIDPVGEHSDADIWIALSQAHLKEYIDTLPQGLDAPVREGGSSLSSGQRQLLCFARALLRKSKILVLDEATSAVDLDTDQAIQEIIRGPAFADVTMFIIAHRLNTIIDSDRVLVMDGGKVAELDRPATLLAKKSSMFYSLAHEAGFFSPST